MIERRFISAILIAFLAGCAGTQVAPAPGGGAPLRGLDSSVTAAHALAVAVHTDHGVSRMRPDAKGSKALVYIGDWSTNDVYVYDFKTGKEVGTLTGFDEPYGMCTDAKGDVYVTNFGNGTLDEVLYGGTKISKTWSPGGEPIGCSISGSGDVSITSFSPGEVTVYAKGKTTGGLTYSDSSCEYQWTMGYDNKGDLVGVGEYTRIDVCALLAGSKSETTLTEGGGMTIDFPGGTSWDGKYIAVGDQEAGGTYQTGDWRATISGTTITAVGSEIKYSDTCYSDYVDDVNPFFVGDENITPKSKKSAKWMVGPNLWCADGGSGGGDAVWKYPAGGLPIRTIGNMTEPYGTAVGIKP